MVYNGVLMPDKRARYGKEYVHIWSSIQQLADITQWHHSTYKSFCSNYGNHYTPAAGSHCWNDEAVQGMKTDLSTIWNSFAGDLDTEIDRVTTATSRAFDKVLKIAASARANESRAANNVGSGMRTFAANLLHREHLTRYGIEKATEAFASNLSSLRADALSSVRTAFVGQLMEPTYHAANMEYGTSTSCNLTRILLLTLSSRLRQRSPSQNSHHAFVQLRHTLR
jgi:hypothetical protein